MKGQNINIKFIDASDWQELTWYNSGGTRAKKVLQDHEGNEYYFKCSEKNQPKQVNPKSNINMNFGMKLLHFNWANVLA